VGVLIFLMIEFILSRKGFTIKEVWFSEYPFDINGYDFINMYSIDKKKLLDEYSMVEQTTLIIDLNQSLDDIWDKFSPGVKYEIRRAERDGITTAINAHYQDFLDLNYRFRSNKHLGKYSYPQDIMEKFGFLILGYYKGKIICGNYHFMDDKIIRWVIGASDRFSPKNQTGQNSNQIYGRTSRLLIWKAIIEAKQRGLSEFDLGGFYTGIEDSDLIGINRFKNGFGGELIIKYNYQKTGSIKGKIA
jgi:hypothetical protein